MKFRDNLNRLFLLGALAYLGFYVFGLVIGVFSPTAVVGLTVLAVAFAIIATIHAVRIRRAMTGPDRAAVARDLHKFRERRGF